MATCVPWPLDTSCCDEWDTLEPAAQDRATELAWSTLRVLSGGQVGNCPVTLMPCVSPRCDACTWIPRPRLIDGEWVNFACGRRGCICEPVCEIVLDTRIARLDEIIVDGEIVAPTAYRVDNGHRIVRTDDECWPTCLTRDFTVTYVPGIDPGATGAWAAGTMACEYAKACAGAKCRLPSTVTAIARQGVAMQITEGMFPGGIVGIREVDAFLYSVNPNRLVTPPKVWSPDVPWAHHRYVATS